MLAILWPSLGGAKDGLKIVRLATGEYPPYTSEHLPHFGVDAHLVSEAFALVGIKAVFEFLPWKRSFSNAKTGISDGTLPWAKRSGREIDFRYSNPVIEVDREYFYHLKSIPIAWDPKAKDYRQLRGRHFGAGVSANYGPAFQTAEAQGVILVTRTQTAMQNFKMLLRGRVDIVISKGRVGEFVLRNHFTTNEIDLLTRRPESAAAPSHDYLLISKRGPQPEYFLKSFNRGLERLRRSGRYEEIMENFENGAYAKLE